MLYRKVWEKKGRNKDVGLGRFRRRRGFKGFLEEGWGYCRWGLGEEFFRGFSRGSLSLF